MIQINLLKTTVRKRPKKLTFDRKALIKIGVIVVIFFACIGVVVVVKNIINASSRSKQEYTVKDDYTPSTYTHPNNVEEPVRDNSDETDKLKRSGVYDSPYAEMSFNEKINYEIRFAKNICDLLNRTVKTGVDFKSIQARSFNSFNGTGICDSKEDIINLLRLLKNEKVEILPKPHTLIKKTGDGYHFSVSCITEFGYDHGAPFSVGTDDLPEYEDLEFLLKKIMNTAEDDKVSISSGPKRLDASFRGDFRQFRYHISGLSTYPNFVAYVSNLYKREIPCAFEMFKITALNEMTVQIEADIVFTTSN